MQKLIFIFVTLLLVTPCTAQSALDDNQQSKVGPVPPQAVIERDLKKAQEEAITYQVQQTLAVPGYSWRHGCGPTALGMVIGYYDGMGFDDLIPGDASTQTSAVNQAIASGGTSGNPNPPGFEEHYEDYARPEDAYPNLLDDDYITQGREPHVDDCIADFMHTSKSTHNNYYGWSWFNHVGIAFTSFASMQIPNYSPSYERYRMSDNTLTWEVLTNEIDNGRPMVFLVDTGGDNDTDHFVTIIGYRDQPSQQYGCLDTWYPPDVIRWENFQEMGSGVPWGIYGGVSFTLKLKSPEINVKDNDADIPSGTGLYDFGGVSLGWSKTVTFTIENLGDANLVLTGIPPVEISGIDANEFGLVEQPSSLIMPSESTTFEIAFIPTKEGLCSATVSIDNNDIDENPYTFSLTGTGTLAATVYVDADAPGLNDGSSWTNAYNYLQDALAEFAAFSSLGDKILVAEGIYKPDANTTYPNGTGDRSLTFQLINSITIKGGYAGFGEPDPNFRDINLYPAILSGDLQGNDVEVSNPAEMIDDPCRAENSYHVVTGSGPDSTAVLDGFIITSGNANGDYPDDYDGGGMYNRNDNDTSPGPTITNCRFYQNCAKAGGGGMQNHQSNPTLTNCTFEGNFASYFGGGISHSANHSILTNCTFIDNVSGLWGGGLYSSDNPEARLTGCLFCRNSASSGGGIYNGIDSTPTITNCTFSDNSASSAGGGIQDGSSSSSTLTNCILWGNSVGGTTDEQAQINSTTATVNYSCIQGLTGALGGIGNIDCDPCFADPCGGDYHLQSGAGRWDPNGQNWVVDVVNSPAIDAGDPSSDWAGELWPHGKRINMGAYGGTPQASMSLSSIGNIANLDNDLSDNVDLYDLALFVDKWLYEQVLLAEDLDRNGFVDFRDYAIFAGEWPR